MDFKWFWTPQHLETPETPSFPEASAELTDSRREQAWRWAEAAQAGVVFL